MIAMLLKLITPQHCWTAAHSLYYIDSQRPHSGLRRHKTLEIKRNNNVPPVATDLRVRPVANKTYT